MLSELFWFLCTIYDTIHRFDIEEGKKTKLMQEDGEGDPLLRVKKDNYKLGLEYGWNFLLRSKRKD